MRYTVVGDRAVFGLQPGETGDLELTGDQAYALVQGGHLERAVDVPEDASAPEVEVVAPVIITAADSGVAVEANA